MRQFSRGGRLFAFLLAALMMVSAIPVVAFAEEITPLTQSTADRIKDGAFKADAPYRIAMLDCGRKYFTAAQIKKLIDHLSKDGYNQLQLSFGNGGFRFLLDDMSINYGGLTLSDSTVRKYIADGNIVWGSEDKTCLTQDEMDEILLYAGRRSIEIVPMLNVPAHCEGLVAGSPYGVEVKNQWGTKTWNLNVTSEDAKNYGYGTLQKYATYFAARGVRFFNFGADEAEVASVVTGSVAADSFNAAIATFTAGAAELIQSVGMTPRCFNDVFMSGNSAVLTRLKDAGTQVCYWQQTLGMTAKEIEALGFELINTNSDWYYVAHDTASSDRISYGGGYLKLPSLTNSVWPSLNDFRLSSGTQTLSDSSNNVGSMFCLWLDKPDVYTADFLLDESHSYSALWQVGHMADIYWHEDVKPSLPTDAPSTDATEPETETPIVKPEGATETEVNVTLKPGETWTSATYAWKGSLVAGEGDRAIAEATISTGTRNEASSLTRKDPGFAGDETHLIGDGKNWLCVNADGSLYNTTDASKATKWVISGTKNDYVIFSNGHYLTYTRNEDQYVLATRSDPAVNTDDGEYSSTGVTTTRWQYGSDGVYGTQWKSQWGSARLPYLRCVSGTWKMLEADLAAFAGQSSPTYTYDYDPGYVGEYATVTFEGMGVPSKLTTTYYLTNGTDQIIKFNVTVEPETLDATDTQDVEMFLTSHWVGQTVVTTDNVADHIKTLTPAQAYGKYGVSLASLVLKKGVDEDSHEVWYWKGTKLPEYVNCTCSDHKGGQAYGHQGSNPHISSCPGTSGEDRSSYGTDFMYIRYWQGKWEIKATADGSWQAIASTDQLVAYYMQVQNISPEITTTFRDYGKIAGIYYSDLVTTTGTGGYPGQEDVGWADGFFGVGSAVVYPDRSMSHTEQEIWDETLVLFYDHYTGNLRSPGIMKAYDTDDFRVTRITITHGHHVIKGQTADNDAWKTTKVWNGDDSVAWEKTGVSGEEWYDEETLWTREEGVDYSEGILLDEDLLSRYKVQEGIVGEAWLLLFYVEPVAKNENLKVVYYDDTLRKDIKNDIQISVPQDKDFLNGLNNGENSVESGNIVLDDAAYITNSAGVNQTINKKLSQLDGIEDTYKKGNYYYVGADISEDGKTLTLHYAKKGTLNIIYWDDTTNQQIPTNSLIYYVPEGKSFLNGITYPDGDDEKTLTVTEGTRFDLPQYGCIYAFEQEGEEDLNKIKCIYIHTDLADSAVNATLENRELYYHVNAEVTSAGATLVLHYLRKNVLNIIYRDDVAETDIAEIEDFAETPYDKTFKDMVDDKITDKDGNEKTVEKDLSKLPDDKLPADKKDDYKDYYVDRTEVSEDGLTLIIHYKAKSTLKVNYYDKTNKNSLITFLTEANAPDGAVWTNTNGVWSAPTLTTPWTAELVLSSVPGVVAPYNVVGKYVLVAADTTTTDEGRTLNLYYELVTLPVTIVWVDEEGNQIEIETDYRIEYGKTLEDVLDDATVSGSDVTLGDDPTLTEWNGTEQTIIKNLPDMSGIDEKYQDGSYVYDKADLSEDGMTLTLRYVRKKNMNVVWMVKDSTTEIWRDTDAPGLTDLPWATTWNETSFSNGSYTAETDLTKIEGVAELYKKQYKYVNAEAKGDTLYLYYRLATMTVTVKWWDDDGNEQITKEEFIIYDDTTLKDSLTDVTVDENGKATLGENPGLTEYDKTVNPIIKNLLDLTDEKIEDKYKTGLYEYVEADLSEDGKTLTLHYTLKTFDKSISYVLDYGLPVKIDDLSALFNKQYGIEKNDIQFIYYDEVVLNYAQVLWDEEDWNHLTYKLNKLMEGVDTVVLTAYVTDEAIEATLTLKFIPATNIYYEDSFNGEFLTPEGGSFELNGKDTQIEWETIDAGKELFQRADPVGSYRFYGSDPAYTNDGFGLSAGSALKVTVPYIPKGTEGVFYPTVSFTFTGTGFDIISRTGVNQGRIGVTITKGDEVYEYGVINRGDNELYQVPVMSVEGLEHGTYEVIITVYPPMEMINRENGDEKKFLYGTAQGATFVLDGIRIYDPVDTSKEENAEVLAAYEADGQVVLNRQEIRDLLINQGNELDVTVDQGMGTAADLEGFTNIGPNNEVYLMPGQSIEVEITLKAGEALELRARAMFEAARLDLIYTVQGQIDHFDWEEVSSAADTKWFNKYFPEDTTITLTLTNASTDTNGWIALTDLEIVQSETVREAQ